MSTVLVIGADGMLGQDLVRVLGEAHTVVGHTIGEDGDLRDLAALRKCIHGAKPDAVVNTAAITNVDGCESDPDLAYAVNGLGARNVAVVANEVDAPVLQVSTDFVFSGDKGAEYLEYDETNPLSVYGDSKLWGEKLVRDHADRFWIVRTQWLYGAGGKNFVETILGRAREGAPLRVVDDQHGCPTSTLELSRAIKKIIEEGGYGIYHASGRGGCSWFEFSRKMIEIAGIDGVDLTPMSSDELDRPATRPPDSRMRNYHMELSFGDPMLTWKDALAEYLGVKQSA